MSTIPNRTAERRKAARLPRSLRISWRLLGNRDFRFGEAALKDISTTGMALQVDQSCGKGSLIIVQFDGTGDRCGEPILLRTEWAREADRAPDGTATYLVGCSFTSPFTEKELKALLDSARSAPPPQPSAPKAAPAKAHPPSDPFLMGGKGEKRTLVRRAGVVVAIAMCRADGGARIDATVVDRSVRGIGILSPLPFTRGSLLKVRPCAASEKIPFVQVQVRNCRQKGKQWHIGCDFSHSPPMDLLMLFG
jgi:hypothetical protein